MEYTEKELQQEVWRDIDGYDGMYQVSDLGRVRSLKCGKTRVIRAYKVSTGYLGVSLCKDSKVKKSYIHRLVANAFIPNSDESKTQINHRNECKSDNRVDNLEWCDYQYNLTYNEIHRRRKQYIHTQPVRGKLKELYNPDLTYNENLELFKANGIECCAKTVQLLRKDLGLTKQYNKK